MGLPDMVTEMRLAAEIGGLILKNMQRTGLARTHESGSDFVTEADLKSQDEIVKYLSDACSGIPIVAEEQDVPKIEGETFFLVDPLDGTWNYEAGSPDYGVIVGFVKNGRPQCGVIYEPARDRTIVVERGNGVWCNEQLQLLTPPLLRPFREAIIGTEIGWWCSDSFMREVLVPLTTTSRCQGLTSVLSAAASTVKLILGEIAGYVNCSHAKCWDFIVAALAMEEWGGAAAAPDGSPLHWDKIPMQGVFAPHRAVADQLLALTKNWKPRESFV